MKIQYNIHYVFFICLCAFLSNSNAYFNNKNNLHSTNEHKYYVSTSGVDTGDGSIDAPWRHIAFATCSTSNAHIITAGDTLFIRSGTYHEHGLYVYHSGTSTASVVIKSYRGELATIDGDTTDFIFNLGTSELDTVRYLVFDSLHLSNAKEVGFFIRHNLRPVHNITIKNCFIEKTKAADNTGGVYTTDVTDILIDNCKIIGDGNTNHNNAGIITFGGSRITVSNCEISNIAIGIYFKFSTVGSGQSFIQNCYIHDISYFALSINSNNVIIKNNLLATNLYAGIDLWGSAGSLGGSLCRISHNTVYCSKAPLLLNWGSGYNTETGDHGARNDTIIDNVFYAQNNEYGSYSLWPYAPDSAFSNNPPKDSSNYNCYFNFASSAVMRKQDTYYTLANWKASVYPTYDNHSVQGQPLFVNFSGLLDSIEDFELLPQSPGHKAASDSDSSDMGADVSLISRKVPDVMRNDSIKGLPDTVTGYLYDSTFEYKITATRRPILYTAAPLPQGLKLDTLNGIITGAPQDTGVTQVKITAANENGKSTEFTLVIHIIESTIPIITSQNNVHAILGRSFSYKINALSKPDRFFAKNLPQGLSLNDSSGVISGIISTITNNVCTLSATNSKGSSDLFLFKIFIIDAKNANKKTPIQSGSSYIDTFAVNNSALMHDVNISLLAGTGDNVPTLQNNAISVVASGNDYGIRVCIDNNTISECSGFRGLLIVSDNVKSDTICISRPIIRINNNCDNKYTQPLSWLPLSVTALPDTSYAKKILGSFFTDTNGYSQKKCRFVQWNTNDNGIYSEYNSISDSLFDFKPGRLFWIKARDSTYIDFGKATSIALNDTFPVTLSANNWTDFSVPFNFPITIEDIFSATKTKTGNNYIDSLEFYYWKKSGTSYVTEPLFLSQISGINSTNQTLSGRYGNAYTIYNTTKSTVTLYFPPTCSAQAILHKVKTASDSLHIKSSAWSVKISCRDAKCDLISHIYCGGDEKLSKPIYYRASPSFTSLSLQISDSMTGNFHGNIATNSSIADGIIFTLLFSNNTAEKTVMSASIDSLINLPDKVEAAIIGCNSSNDYFKNDSIFVSVDKNSKYTVYLAVGKSDYLNDVFKKISMSPEISLIYPNPLKKYLCVQYVVPYKLVDQLCFSLVNLQGKCIWKQTLNKPQAGKHEIRFNAAGNENFKLASGIYLLGYDVKYENKTLYKCHKRVFCL